MRRDFVVLWEWLADDFHVAQMGCTIFFAPAPPTPVNSNAAANWLGRWNSKGFSNGYMCYNNWLQHQKHHLTHIIHSVNYGALQRPRPIARQREKVRDCVRAVTFGTHRQAPASPLLNPIATLNRSTPYIILKCGFNETKIAFIIIVYHHLHGRQKCTGPAGRTHGNALLQPNTNGVCDAELCWTMIIQTNEETSKIQRIEEITFVDSKRLEASVPRRGNICWWHIN